MDSRVDMMDVGKLDPRWWKTLSQEEAYSVIGSGRLTGELLERCWRFHEWQGPLPEYVDLFVRRDQLDRLVNKIKR